MLIIGNNGASYNARRNLLNTTLQLQTTYSHLSSGQRITSASDDAAGLGISERMRANIRSLGAIQRNIQDGIGLLQTAEGTLDGLSSIVGRIRELTVRNNTYLLTTEDHEAIQAEYSELVSEYESTIDAADFNGIELFTSNQILGVQVGIESGETVDIRLSDYRDHASTMANYSMLTLNGTITIQAIADAGLDLLSAARGNLGATENRLRSSLRATQIAAESLSAAESRIRDADVAHETAHLTKLSILQQASLSVLAQANVQPQIALGLLG